MLCWLYFSAVCQHADGRFNFPDDPSPRCRQEAGSQRYLAGLTGLSFFQLAKIEMLLGELDNAKTILQQALAVPDFKVRLVDDHPV